MPLKCKNTPKICRQCDCSIGDFFQAGILSSIQRFATFVFTPGKFNAAWVSQSFCLYLVAGQNFAFFSFKSDMVN